MDLFELDSPWPTAGIPTLKVLVASRKEQHLSCRFSFLQASMSLGGLTQLEAVADVNLESSLGDPLEDFGGALFQLRTRRYMVNEGRAGQEERAFPH